MAAPSRSVPWARSRRSWTPLAADVPAAVARCAERDAPRVVAVLARQFRDIERAEEAVQAALVRALEVWPDRGIPNDTAAWLFTVSRRRVLDAMRDRERPSDAAQSESFDPEHARTDQVGLLFACCHPSLAPQLQVSLVLKVLCGRSHEQIARAFLQSPRAISRDLARASAKIRDAGVAFAVPAPQQRPRRLAAVLAAVYLLFNEGYAPTQDDRAVDPQTCAQAIDLGQRILALMPDEPEVMGLLALMVLHHARRDSRVSEAGELVPLSEQDRGRWHRDEIGHGKSILGRAVALGRPGAYQLQAAVAALHADAERPRDTDWTQITALYGALLQKSPTPVVELNAAVALSMATSAERGLAWIERLKARGVLERYPLLYATEGDMLERLGRTTLAARAFERALALTASPRERAFLQRRLASLGRVQRRRRPRISSDVPALSDWAWSRVKALFPQRRGRGRPARSDRLLLDAVMWVLATGRPWRELPPEMGPWQTAYHRFRIWENDGRMLAVLQRLSGHAAAQSGGAHLARGLE